MRRCRAARSATSTQPRLGGAQGLDRRLPLALAQVQVGEALERLRVAGAQAAGAPQRLHGAGPVLERLVAGRQVQAGVRRARIVRRDGEEPHQPVRRRFGIPVLAGAACQLKKGLAVFRLDLQDLLEVRERRLAVGDPLQAVLAALEQQGHAGRRRQRRRGQPVRQQRVEQDAPPRRLEIGAQQLVRPHVGGRIVGPQLDAFRERGDGVVDPARPLVDHGRLAEQRRRLAGIADHGAQARQRPRLADRVAARARHAPDPEPRFQPFRIACDDAAVDRQRRSQGAPPFGVERDLEIQRRAERAAVAPRPRPPRVGPPVGPRASGGQRQIGDRGAPAPARAPSPRPAGPPRRRRPSRRGAPAPPRAPGGPPSTADPCRRTTPRSPARRGTRSRSAPRRPRRARRAGPPTAA